MDKELFISKKITDFANSYKLLASVLLLEIAQNDYESVVVHDSSLRNLRERIFSFIKINCSKEVFEACENYDTNNLPDYMSSFVTIDVYNKILSLKYMDIEMELSKDKLKINKMSIELNPLEEIPYINMAKILYETGKYAETLKLCEYIRTLTETAPVWEIMGKVYRSLGRYGESVEAYKKYLELNENDTDALEALNEIYEEALK